MIKMKDLREMAQILSEGKCCSLSPRGPTYGHRGEEWLSGIKGELLSAAASFSKSKPGGVKSPFHVFSMPWCPATAR